MAYFRCIVNQGESGPSFTINVITTVMTLYGQTANLKKDDVLIDTATIDNEGTCAFTVNEAGNYIIEASNGYQTFSTEVTVQTAITAELKGFTWRDWLATADIPDTGYSSLDDVLEDEVAVRKLMTIHASVDYLVGSLA